MAQSMTWRECLMACFPEHAREHAFPDKEKGGEIVADVFLEETGTVLMFRQEMLPPEEFFRDERYWENHQKGERALS